MCRWLFRMDFWEIWDFGGNFGKKRKYEKKNGAFGNLDIYMYICKKNMKEEKKPIWTSSRDQNVILFETQTIVFAQPSGAPLVSFQQPDVLVKKY